MLKFLRVISELRGVTCHMGSHSVTCHLPQVNTPRLTSAGQAGTRFTYPRGIEDWVDLSGWVHTEMVYLSDNRAECRAALLIEANVLPITPRHHPVTRNSLPIELPRLCLPSTTSASSNYLLTCLQLEAFCSCSARRGGFWLVSIRAIRVGHLWCGGGVV